MSTETEVQNNTFAYISCYLGNPWTIDNPPRCGAATFTFDSRHVERPNDPLVVIGVWNYQVPQPTVQDLLAIPAATANTEARYVMALLNKRDVILATNQIRVASSLPVLTTEEILALV